MSHVLVGLTATVAAVAATVLLDRRRTIARLLAIGAVLGVGPGAGDDTDAPIRRATTAMTSQ